MDRSSGLLWSAIAALSAVLLVGAYFGTKLTLETQPASASPHRLQSSGKWDRYVASEDYCPGKNDLGAPVGVQERVELCLLNYARGVKGLGPLNIAPALMESSPFIRCHPYTAKGP